MSKLRKDRRRNQEGADGKPAHNVYFIARVREFQNTHSFTLRKTAAVIGLSAGELSRIYKGIHNPSVITIMRTAVRLNVPPSTLLPAA